MNKEFLLDDYDNFIIGANYFSSHAGTRMWELWDPRVVEKDFKILKEYGIEVLRVFPIWSDFQPITAHYIHGKSYDNQPREIMLGEKPLDDSKEGIAGISVEMFEHFDEFCLLAEKYDIKFIVGLLTGFMSDRRFVPPALNERNIFTDPFAQKWTVRYVRYFVERYLECDAISAWDLGNEVCWLDNAGDSDASYAWASLITSTIKAIDHKRPVVSGLDWSHSDGGGVWNTMEMGEIMDIMTSHPYACFSYAQNEGINDLKTIRYVTSTTVAIGDIARKPCLLEEVGSIGYSTLNERSESDFIRSILFDSWANNCYGMLWWCAFDQGILGHNPYRWNGRGSDYGLFAHDYRAKPCAEECKKFYNFLRKLPFKALPERIRDTVCIIPRGTRSSERNFVAMIDTLGKQAGLDIKFNYADQRVDDAPLYILPCVSSAQYVNKDRFVELIEKVKSGSDLFISMENCYLRWFPEITGIDVYQRRAYNDDQTIEISGKKLNSYAIYEYICDNIDGEDIAKNAHGNPVFVCHKLGKGRVYSFLAPFENKAMAQAGVCSSNEYLIYKYLKDRINSGKVASCDNSQIGLTEHILSDNERVLVAINYCSDKQEADINFSEEWKVKSVIYGNYNNKAYFEQNDAVVLIIKK